MICQAVLKSDPRDNGLSYVPGQCDELSCMILVIYSVECVLSLVLYHAMNAYHNVDAEMFYPGSWYQLCVLALEHE